MGCQNSCPSRECPDLQAEPSLGTPHGTNQDQVKLVDWDERLGAVLYLPSSLVVLAAGIGLVGEGDWGLDQAWIVLGFVIFGLSFLIGVLFYIPQGRKLEAAVTAGGHDSADAVARAPGRSRR